MYSIFVSVVENMLSTESLDASDVPSIRELSRLFDPQGVSFDHRQLCSLHHQ
jgi:hypothetical protein